jgi:hypothetical protein
MIIKLTTCLILVKPQQMGCYLFYDKMTEDAVFIGTDATENWGKPDFQEFAKPYFDGRLGILQYWNVIFILINQSQLV